MLCAARCKYRTQKSRQKSPSRHHRTTLSGHIFAIKACIDNRKNLLSSNTSATCPDNMVNFGPLTAEIGSGVWGTPTNFILFFFPRLTCCDAVGLMHHVCRNCDSVFPKVYVWRANLCWQWKVDQLTQHYTVFDLCSSHSLLLCMQITCHTIRYLDHTNYA